MTREELKLNDFEGFERYLKTLEIEELTGLAVVYDRKTNTFFPPIIRPLTLPEYQLDHYALWMVIYTYGLKDKPRFCYKAHRPAVRCYACDWMKYTGRHNCDAGCPMIKDGQHIDPSNPEMHCVSEFVHWAQHRDKESAYDLAHLEWRET